MKTRARIAVVLGAIVALGLVAASPSGAQEYTGVISTTLGRPSMDACSGTTNTATGTGFLPGTEVTFTLDLPSGPVVLGESRASGTSRATADAEGVATVTFTLPSGTAPGTYDVVTTGLNSAGVADEHVVRLQVTACETGTGSTTSPGTGGDDLARTGSSLAGATRIGVLVLAAGATLLLVTRRRASRSA